MPMIIRINVVRNGYPIKNNLQIQCNSNQNSRDILHGQTKKMLKFIGSHKTPKIVKAILNK